MSGNSGTLAQAIVTWGTEIRQAFADTRADFGARFDGVETRLDRVETRLDGVEERLGNVEGRLGAVEERLGTVEGQVSHLRRVVGRVEGKTDQVALTARNIQVRMAGLEQSLLHSQVGNIESNVRMDTFENRITLIEKRLDLRDQD